MTANWNNQKFLKCPHCGGTSGFTISKVVRHSENISWKGLSFHVEGETLRQNKLMRCMDCKSSVGSFEQLDMTEING
ncbi:MAG: hypothetical protein ACKE51_02650 [Methylococcaceae bacterium]